jgi:hypothetical protein
MKSNNDGFLLLGFGLVFLAMSLLIVWHYSKLFNQVWIDQTGIRIQGLIKKKFIGRDEVDEINLTGKEFERFMFTSMPMEAISIVTKKSDKEVILVKYYSNMDRIRTALHFIKLRLERQQEITSECFITVERQEPEIKDLTSLQKYGGNHLLTLNGLIVHGSLIFVLWLFVFSNSPMDLGVKTIVSLFALTFCFGLFGYQLHYFRLNTDYLLVKNHVWLWRNDAYLISDLREIVFEEPHKMSTSLRVITKNYETKLYPAGSVRRKSWSRLSKEFSKMGILVRNEAFFD